MVSKDILPQCKDYHGAVADADAEGGTVAVAEALVEAQLSTP